MCLLQTGPEKMHLALSRGGNHAAVNDLMCGVYIWEVKGGVGAEEMMPV